jgi:hypothetical protein
LLAKTSLAKDMATRGLDEIQLGQLARELVMNVRNYKFVFADFGIDEDDYYHIEKNPYFKKVKEHFTIEWNSTLSSEQRLRLVSLAYLEQLTPVLTKRAMREETALPDATDVSKMLLKITGMGDPKMERPGGERFVITINLGADTETYDKSIEIKANETPLIEGGNHG